MNPAVPFQVGERICELLCLVLLIRYSRRHLLVYGVSVDFVWLQMVGTVAFAIQEVVFWASGTVSEQYQARYPVSGPATPPVILLALDVAIVYVCAGFAYQAAVKYRKTRHRLQYFSGTCICWFLGWAVVLVWFLVHYWRGRATINALDVVEAVRWCGVWMLAVRWWPQVTTNLFTQVFRGFPSQCWYLEVAGLVSGLAGWWVSEAWHCAARLAYYYVLAAGLLAGLGLQLRYPSEPALPL